MKRVFLTALCLVLCLSMLGGCAKTDVAPDADTTDPADTAEAVGTDDTGVEPDDTEPADSDPADSDPADTDPAAGEDAIAASLVSVRQAMIDTPAMVAVAYMGGTDSMESVDAVEWVKTLLPGFTGNLPFITAIDDSHIVGDRYGELYLVVPCDENASVSVNRVDENGEVTELLYRSESGDPLLVFANNTGFPADTQMNIVDGAGDVLSYSFTLNDLSYLTQYSDGSIYDFTPYAEALCREYADFQEYGWNQPERSSLIDTSWEESHVLADGSTVRYSISFNEDSAAIQWNDGFISLPWELLTLDGERLVKFTVNSDEERICHILIDGDYLYLSQDIENGVQRADEPLSLIMNRTYG